MCTVYTTVLDVYIHMHVFILIFVHVYNYIQDNQVEI